MPVSKGDEPVPFEDTVTKDTRVGSFIGKVAGDEGFNDLPPERLAGIHNMQWKAQLLRYLACSLEPLLIVVGGVPKKQSQPFDVVALFYQQSSRYRTVHTTAQGYNDFCHFFSTANYRGFQAGI